MGWPGDITEGLPPKSTDGFIAPPLSWDDKWTFIEEDGTEVRKLPKESPERQCEHRAFLMHVLEHVYVDEESDVKARKIRAYLKDGITPTGRDDPRFQTENLEGEMETDPKAPTNQSNETHPAAVSVIPGEACVASNNPSASILNPKDIVNDSVQTEDEEQGSIAPKPDE